jgi:hypothetical protein
VLVVQVTVEADRSRQTNLMKTAKVAARVARAAVGEVQDQEKPVRQKEPESHSPRERLSEVVICPTQREVRAQDVERHGRPQGRGNDSRAVS